MFSVADNIYQSDMVSYDRLPPVGELGEVDDKVLVGTDEVPMLPSKEGMEV